MYSRTKGKTNSQILQMNIKETTTNVHTSATMTRRSIQNNKQKCHRHHDL
jgi:hypothetical protein